MKKFILSLILAFLVCGQAFAATVSKSFTAANTAGGVLSVKVGDSFTYSVSGTFVGTWVLQSSTDGVSTWQTVATGTGAGSGTVLAESRGSNQLAYRMYCSAYTSGTIVTTMTDETGYITPVDEFKNKNGKTVAHTTENGFVVDGSFTGGTEDGAVVFNVKQYGAKGDGVQAFDGAITAADNTFTSASASFAASDIGKVITIQSAAGTNLDLTTTIASINSATSVELTNAATDTVSSSSYTYGTDDTTAIRAAFAALGSDSVIGKTGIIFFPEGTYIVNGAFDQSGGSQIAFPAIAFASPVTTFHIKGPVSSAPNAAANNGAIIYGTKYGTNGENAIMSVTDSGGGGTGNIARINAIFENIRFRTVQDPTHSALELKDADQAQGDNVTFDTGPVSNLALPTHNDSFALKLPDMLAGNVSGGWKNLKIKTYYNGVRLGEHSLIWSAFIVLGVNALNFYDCRYPAQVFQVAVESVQNSVLVSSSGSTTSYFKIYDLDIEHNTGTFANVTNLVDASNLAIGEIHYSIFDNGGGSTFTKSGGKNVSLHNIKTNQMEYHPTTGDHFSIVSSAADSTTSGGTIILKQNDYTALDSGSRLGAFGFAGSYSTTGTQYVYGAVIQAIAAEAFTASAAGSHLQFRTAAIGSTSATERIRITSEGNVGVGTTTPTSLLQVGATASTAMRFTSGGNLGIGSTAPGATLDIGTGNMRVGIGTTTAGTLVCVKSISGGTSILGYCTGSLTNSICGTCN